MGNEVSKRYISRAVDDPTFTHCLDLLAFCKGWVKSVRVGQEIEFNDINMIQIPMEMAESLLRYVALEDTDLGAACRNTLTKMDSLDAIFSARLPTSEGD